jgi:hypothetical protein
MKHGLNTDYKKILMKKSEAVDLFDKQTELLKLVRHIGLTYLPLRSDVTYAVKQWQNDPSQFWSRTSIRCICAAVEAKLFAFRKMAEKMVILSRIEFEPKEIEILTEKRVVEVNGIQTTRPKFLPFPDSLKESFRLFAKAAGTTVIVDYGDKFTDLCKTFEVRNRLMHPKQPFDVQVSTEDINTADRGIIWFDKTSTSVTDQCHAHFGRNIEIEKGKLKLRDSKP